MVYSIESTRGASSSHHLLTVASLFPSPLNTHNPLMTMSLQYDMKTIDTRDYRSVAFGIIQAFHEAYPESNSFYIPRLVNDVKNIFAGKFENLCAIDTHYHDFEHTLQATLCLTRILISRQLRSITPTLTDEDFKLALVAIMLHDTGYLKSKGDREGTGAKYTRIHEQRSCQYAARYLSQFGWDAERIEAVQNMIRCTGPNADIATLNFSRPIEKVLGQAVCTADYIGQMSDPHYVGKLYHLYEEFEESDNYNNIPQKERAFSSFQELLFKTPLFWEKIVLPRMHVECDNMLQFLTLDDHSSPYLEAIEDNIKEIRTINASPTPVYKRQPQKAIA